MPRITRFERDRISKLFGKTKIIQKDIRFRISNFEQKKIDQKMQLPSAQKQHDTFRSSDYVQLIKVNRMPNGVKQIQKKNYKMYDDDEIFGGQVVNFMRKNHDHDCDTPEEQVKYDVNKGIKRLMQQIERRKNGNNADYMASERAPSMGARTPSALGIRIGI